MTLFIIACLLLLGITLLILLRPLLKTPTATAENSVSEEQLTAQVLREQLQQLQADFDAGLIEQATFEQSQNEIHRRVLEELSSQENNAVQSPQKAKTSALVVLISLPLLAIGTYLLIGSPQSLNPPSPEQAQAMMINGMVEKLAKKLEENPNDYEGWARLGRSYRVLGKPNESAQAYAKAGPALEKSPEMMIDYAQTLAELDQNDLNARANVWIEKALQLEPDYPMGLVLGGGAAFQRQDYKLAVFRWEKLVPLVEPGTENAKQVLDSIAEAKAKLKEQNSPTPTNKANKAAKAASQ
jgi:cytochrome c-type biogenesis protein CcmH